MSRFCLTYSLWKPLVSRLDDRFLGLDRVQPRQRRHELLSMLLSIKVEMSMLMSDKRSHTVTNGLLHARFIPSQMGMEASWCCRIASDH